MTIVPEVRTALEAAITALSDIVADVEVGGQTTILPTKAMVGALMFAENTLKAFDFGDVKNELHHLLNPKYIQWNHRVTHGYDLTDLAAAIA